MKAELTDINDTRKDLKVEIPSDVVNERIDRLARDYSKRARVPGFRPGKAPARIIKQRYKSEILHDLMHDLIPRAVDDAPQQLGLLQPRNDPVAKEQGIAERLERQGVVGHALHDVEVRVAAAGEHELVIVQSA